MKNFSKLIVLVIGCSAMLQACSKENTTKGGGGNTTDTTGTTTGTIVAPTEPAIANTQVDRSCFNKNGE